MLDWLVTEGSVLSYHFLTPLGFWLQFVVDLMSAGYNNVFTHHFITGLLNSVLYNEPLYITTRVSMAAAVSYIQLLLR